MAERDDTRALSSDSDGDATPTVGSPPPSAFLPRQRVMPHSLGRYLLLDEIGRGGMGRVLRAYDPKLGREVALKVIELDARRDVEVRERALREAQAMAKLAHPNVVPVYDVDQVETTLFIAMEHVAGTTLRQWIEQGRHTTHEVLHVFEQAGRGLAAAHAAGIVHRDFKPSNVMVGTDGRVRVMDFGIAFTPLGPSSSLDGETLPSSSHMLATFDLTQPGMVMGTPAYMAPEQHLGERIDARADQYAFCVALYEALYGQRPFDGASVQALVQAKVAGLAGLPGSPRLARSLRRALLRGLAPAAEARSPSMQPLIEALGMRGTTRRRGAAVGLLALSTTTAVVGYVNERRPTPCSGAEPRMVEVWDETRREALHAALVGTGVSYGEETATRAGALLDEWSARWIAAHRDACEATAVRGEQSEAVMDLRIACLERRRHQLDALLDVLEQPDAALLERAVEITSELPSLAPCDDVETLRSAVPLPEGADVAQEVEEIRNELDRADALFRVARYADAAALLQDLATRADALGYAPLAAGVHELLGVVLVDQGEHERAERELLQGYELALGSRDDDVALSAAFKLANLMASREGRDDDAVPWRVASRALVRRLGDPPLRVAALHNQDAEKAMRAGNYDAAASALFQALELLQQAHGAKHIQNGMVHINLSVVLFQAHRVEEARKHLGLAREIFEEQLGATHPYSLYAYNNLGVISAKLGDYAAAETFHRKALEGRIAALGAVHPNVAVSHTNLAMTLQEQQRYEEAAEHHLRAIAITEQTLGRDSANLAPMLNNLGALRRIQGRLDDALATHRRALQVVSFEHHGPDYLISELAVAVALADLGRDDEALRAFDEGIARAQGMKSPDPVLVADARSSRADLLVRRGKLVEAERELRDVVEVLERNVPANDLRLGDALDRLGECLVRASRFDDAIPPLERALEIWRERPAEAVTKASTRLWLAKALRGRGGADDRVSALVAEAAVALEPAPDTPARRALARELEAWAAAR